MSHRAPIAMRCAIVGERIRDSVLLLFVLLIVLSVHSLVTFRNQSKQSKVEDTEKIVLQLAVDGRYREAEQLIDNMLEHAKKADDWRGEAACSWLRGRVHFQHGSNRAAIQCYKRAIALDNGQPRYHYERCASMSEDCSSFSIPPARKGIKAFADDIALLELSQAPACRFRGLLARLRKRLTEDPDDFSAAADLARCYVRTGHSFEGKKIFLGLINARYQLSLEQQVSALFSCQAQMSEDVFPSDITTLSEQSYDQLWQGCKNDRWKFRSVIQHSALFSSTKSATAFYCDTFEQTPEMEILSRRRSLQDIQASSKGSSSPIEAALFFFLIAGDSANTRKCISKLLQRSPLNAQLYALAAAQATAVKDYASAAKNYERALQLDPNAESRSRERFNYVRTLSERGDADSLRLALKLCSQANSCEPDPGVADTLRYLSGKLLAEGNTEQAVEVFKLAERSCTSYIDHLKNVIFAEKTKCPQLHRRIMEPAAIEAWIPPFARRVEPDSHSGTPLVKLLNVSLASDLLVRGQLLFSVNEFENQRRIFENIGHAFPDRMRLWQHLVELNRVMGDTKGSCRSYEKCVEALAKFRNKELPWYECMAAQRHAFQRNNDYIKFLDLQVVQQSRNPLLVEDVVLYMAEHEQYEQMKRFVHLLGACCPAGYRSEELTAFMRTSMERKRSPVELGMLFGEFFPFLVEPESFLAGRTGDLTIGQVSTMLQEAVKHCSSNRELVEFQAAAFFACGNESAAKRCLDCIKNEKNRLSVNEVRQMGWRWSGKLNPREQAVFNALQAE